jgi:dTDP-glucose 4,6-dehydratase
MTWSGKHVLVTGAGGFIGSHLTERLAELGATTRALVHYRADGSRGWLDRSSRKEDIEILAGDVTDRDSVLQAMQQIDVVFHLAALIAIPYSYHAPASYVRTNIEGTLNVLQAARSLGVGRVVHTSTSEVYGSALRVPISETHSLQAQSPYSATKIAADKLAEAFHLSYQLPVVTLRPFNTYGPRQSTRAIIPTIITQCLTGGTIRLGNLSPTRDLNYVADTVEGYLKAGVSPEAIGRTINIGSGREISIKDLVELIGTLAGRRVEIEADAQRKRPDTSEVNRLLADNAMSRELLRWAPQVSLEEGLRRTIEWVKEHLDVYRPGAYVL